MGSSIDPETDRADPVYGGVTGTLLVFDPEANTWTELASMGMARQAHTSAAVGGKLYVFGGQCDPNDPQGSVEVYDPISNTWADMSSGMLSCRDYFVAVAL